MTEGWTPPGPGPASPGPASPGPASPGPAYPAGPPAYQGYPGAVPSYQPPGYPPMPQPMNPPTYPPALVPMPAEPVGYHLIHRGGAVGWWRPLIGIPAVVCYPWCSKLEARAAAGSAFKSISGLPQGLASRSVAG